jgi:hypothetical protein
MLTTSSKRAISLWVIALAGLALVWLASGYFLAPHLIAKAYRGESLAIFNRLISGQANHGLSEYLADWNRIANKVSFGLVVLGVFVLLAVVGWTASEVPGRADSAGINMSKARLFVVYGLGAIILGGGLSDLVRDTEHWPFAQYAMFSETEMSNTYTMFRLYGVLDESPLVEVPLDSDLYLQPFDNSRLTPALQYAAKNNRLDEAVTNCLVRYDTLRRAGRHNGPPLVAMRLYRVTWTLEPSAGNVDRPDHKELLAEVRETYKDAIK